MGQRALVKTVKFLSQVQEASQRTSRLWEAVAGVEWTILRMPEQGMAVPATRWNSWPIHPEPGITFKIAYSFDDQHVIFQALWAAVPPGLGRR
jgi:hypothetical protein